MRRKWFLWGDLTSTVFAITCFWFAWKEAEQWLSFAGFGALFMMLIYSACMGFLGLGGIFLALAIGSGKRRFLIASLVCRGLVLAGWFWLWTAIPSLWSWTETGCGAERRQGYVGKGRPRGRPFFSPLTSLESPEGRGPVPGR